MKQTRPRQVSIRYNFDQRIDNAVQLHCWRCKKRMFDYNEAVYEFMRLLGNNALMRSLATDGIVEIVRTRCPYCNAYNSLNLYIEEARPPRARDHPEIMYAAH